MSEEEPVEKSYQSHFYLLIVLILVLWIATPHYVVYLSGVYKTDNPGIFGDMFGSTNTLFSGLAFLGVIWAVFLQTKELGTQRKALRANIAELELQREELKLTREEIKGQKEQLKNQNETQKQQAFDTRFFEFLRLHNDIVARMKYGDLTDRVVFTNFVDSFRGVCKAREQDGVPDPEGTAFNQIRTSSIMSPYQQYLGNLRCILQLIDTSDIANKDDYAQYFRSQFSVDEQMLIYYVCRYGDSYSKIYDLVAKLKILANFDPAHLFEYSDSDQKLLGRDS